jgi:hypothetical protein
MGGLRLGLVAAALAALVALVPAAPAIAGEEDGGASTGTPRLAVSDRLDDRRYVAAGTRGYDVGTEAGRYPAMGFHTRGEMGGIWTPPLKLLDGIWFGVDGQWLPPASQFDSGYGHVRMAIPGQSGMNVNRVDFVPDGRRAVQVGLQFTATGSDREFTLKADAHSELMGAYPWGETTPSQVAYNLPDSAGFDRGRLLFREVGTPPVANAVAHDWAALVGASSSESEEVRLLGHDEKSYPAGFRGPQDPPVVCPVSTVPNSDKPRCDDTEYGKGAGGELRYRVQVPAHRTVSVWFTVAGSDQGLAAAQSEWAAAADDPAGQLAAKVRSRTRLAARTRLSLPGDPLLAQGIDWGKQNIADLTQEARDLRVRVTNQGKDYPPPADTLQQIRFIGAGFPDYPWLFSTDGEYTAFASVGLGQFEGIESHLKALRDVSDIVNTGADSGKVVHEVVTDGSVYFGAGPPTAATPFTGNTDETVKFPSAVALVWRWTGDKAFLDGLYDFSKRNMRYAFSLDGPDLDNWLDGPGNVERTGMGQEKLDVAVYTIRGLLDLAEMARAEGDQAEVTWAQGKAAQMQKAFEQAWWLDKPGTPSYADSLADPPPASVAENTKLYQRYWIGATPMEAELWSGGHAAPGLAIPEHAIPALDLRQQPCFGNQNGFFHTGTGANDPAPDPVEETWGTCDNSVSTVPDEEDIFTLNTAIMAVGEGSYGRLGPDQQQRFTTANRQTQLPTPDEQPGAMPEIVPSPDYGRSIDKPFNERAMVMQAWGQYGTVWPVVHQQLGVSPDLGNGRLEVVPQVPPAEMGKTMSGANIRVGSGSVDVSATAGGGSYRTTVLARVRCTLVIGHVIPAGGTVLSVKLNGQPVDYTTRPSNRGLEVLVHARPYGNQTLEVATR